MPNPINNRHNEEWDTCDRCGWAFPISQLTKQLGKKLCPKDLDDISIMRRQQVIAQVLGDNAQEGGSEKGEHFSDPGELIF